MKQEGRLQMKSSTLVCFGALPGGGVFIARLLEGDVQMKTIRHQ
jgi:hypothetical protein